MQIPSPLSEADLTIKLQYIEGWSVQAGKLHEEYVFDDFAEVVDSYTPAASRGLAAARQWVSGNASASGMSPSPVAFSAWAGPAWL
jgi:hypothetical protein